MAYLPKWSTPNRQAHLVKLFLDSGGFCIFGHRNCQVPEHHYEVFIELLIGDWKSEDREAQRLEWEAESKALHSLGEVSTTITAGRFNAIARDIFHDKQPLFYLEALGIDGLKLQPFARVKLASSYMRLYVSLGDSLRGSSKNKRRKAIRYGKPLPQETQARVARLIWLAVKDYLNH